MKFYDKYLDYLIDNNISYEENNLPDINIFTCCYYYNKRADWIMFDDEKNVIYPISNKKYLELQEN